MTLEEIHASNADFIAFLPQNRTRGQVPFLPLETPEVELRFFELLDADGYGVAVIEDRGTAGWRWSAFDAEGAEADLETYLVRARRECGYSYPDDMTPTAPERN